MQPLEVVPTVFASSGDWKVVRAPESAEPNKSAEIVVERTQGVPIVAKPIVDAVTAATPPAGYKSFLKKFWAAALGRV